MIDQVGNIKGVGLVWCYPKGIANMLSQFYIVVHNKWRMPYDTINYRRSRDIDDLSYEVTTPEGFTCSFTRASQGLHVHKINKRCDRNIFGSNITDNKTIFGGIFCAVIEGKDQPQDHAG